jgi:phospholipid transport system substrate-binding protein
MNHLVKPILRFSAAALATACVAILLTEMWIGFWFVAIFPTPASANDSFQPAEIVVRQMLDSIRKLRTTDDPASRRKLISSIDDSLALDTLSQQALGAQWGKLDSAERQQFLHLIRELLEKLAYPNASDFFSDLGVQFAREQAQGARRVVPTVVKRPEGGAVSINYVLQITHGQWRVIDINLDGQSLAQSVNVQIQAVLRQSSYEGLIAQMKARLAQQPYS